MGQKIAIEAESPKKGMTLAELEKAVKQTVGLAGINDKPIEECKVQVAVNFTGGIKQLVVEV